MTPTEERLDGLLRKAIDKWLSLHSENQKLKEEISELNNEVRNLAGLLIDAGEQKSEDKPILGWYCERWYPNAQDYIPEVSLDKPSDGLFSNGIIPLVAK